MRPPPGAALRYAPPLMLVPRLALSLSIAATAALATSCGATVRPRELTAWQVVGDGAAQCRAAGPGEPLVVDWEAHERGNLEEAMHDGVAVVSYDCKTLRLLKGCSVDSAYGFLAFSKKEQTVRFENADEVSASMPAFGIPLLHDLSGELKQDSTLDLTMILVGKKRTTVREAAADGLVGGAACAGATHFVRGAFVGAFALGTGTRGSANLGLGAFSAATRSAKLAKYRDGEPETCTQVKAGSPSAPDTCDALVRLELVALGAPSGRLGKGPAAKHELEGPLVDEAPSAASGCPPGLFVTDGKCARPSDARTHQCERDVVDCATQCARGHAGSCNNLGLLYSRGEGVAEDQGKAVQLLQQACDGGMMLACSNLGTHYGSGRGAPRDDAKAAALYGRACEGGEATGCYNLGFAHKDGNGVPVDLPKAALLFARACDGGEGAGCANLGVMFAGGIGVPKDAPRSARLLKLACDGGVVFGCFNLGYAYAHGVGVAQSDTRALALYQQACDDGNGLACVNLAAMFRNGTGVAKDERRATTYFEKSCDLGESLGCLNLGVMLANGFGVARDEAKAVGLYRRACAAKVAGACSNLGLMLERGRGVSADRDEAIRNYRLGCQLGYSEACDQLDRLGASR